MNIVPGFIKSRFDLFLPTVLATYVLLTAIAYWGAASRISAGGCEYWADGCGGNYLPWPVDGSNFICTLSTSPMDPVDWFFCSLVKTQLYIPIVIIQIVATAWVGRFVALRIFPPPPKEDVEEIQS